MHAHDHHHPLNAVSASQGAAFSSSGSCHDAAGGSGSQQRQPAAATRGLLHPGVFTQTCRVAGKPWKFEAGRLASLADGACLVTVGGTSVLSTAVVSPEPQLLADGVPLQVGGLTWAMMRCEPPTRADSAGTKGLLMTRLLPATSLHSH
jgi:hypothetical protein